MKKSYKLFLLSSLTVLLIWNQLANAQILNPSFETWNSGYPDQWMTTNIAPFLVNVTQTSDAYSGSSAVQLEIKNFQGIPYPAWLESVNNDSTYLGHPISTKYTNLKGFCKLDLKGTAQFLATAYIMDESEQLIGAGELTISHSISSWTMFEIPIEYYYENDPSYVWIFLVLTDSTSSDDLSCVGSIAKIDNLSADAVTSVELEANVPFAYSLNQNYPNPFNPSTTIRYSVADNNNGDFQDVNLVVFDVLGRKIATLVNESRQPGSYEVTFNAINVPSGVYYYRMTAGSFVETKKMMLIK